MRNIILLIMSTFAFSGCAAQQAMERDKSATRAKTELVGMPKKELLSCAGVPLRASSEGELEVLLFTSGTGSDAHACEATIILKNGVVQKVDYRGHGEKALFFNDSKCGAIVEKCIKQ